MSRSRRQHQVAGPYCATIVDLVQPTLERHDRAAQEPVVCPHRIVLGPNPVNLPAEKLVNRQLGIVELRQNVERGIERLDDADKRPRQPGMTNDGLVVAAVNALGATSEEFDRRRSYVWPIAFRFSNIPNS